MPKIIQILLILTMFIQGCDVPGLIEIKNELNQTIAFSFTFKNIHKSFQSQITEVQPNQKGFFILGFGTRWNDVFLNNYSTKVIDTINLKIGEIDYYCLDKKCKRELFNKITRKSKRKVSIVFGSELIKNSFIEK